MRKTLCVVVCLLISGTLAWAAPTVPAVRLQGPMRPDGSLDEAAWQQAQWQTGFVSASAAVEGANPPMQVQTRFKVLFDNDALYVGVECDEPSPGKIAARYSEHDQDVYQDDCVEVFLDPAGEGRYYQHFVVNTKGAWYDDAGADYGLVHAKLWEFPLQVGTQVDAAGKVWRAEMRFPFAAMNLPPSPQSTWLFNVTRERYAGGKLELSTWAPLKGNFHSPKLFGKLTGVSVDFSPFTWTIGAPQVTISGDGSGNHLLRMKTTVTNGTAQSRSTVLTAYVFGRTGGVQAPALEVAAGGSAEVELPPLKLAGSPREAVVQFGVLDTATQKPMKIVVQHLDSEYKPIALQILRPSYRQNIYATENVPELVFRVQLAPDVAAKTALVAYSLQDAADSVVRAGRATARQLADPQKLEIGGLAAGVYTLKARALDKGDGTVIATATTIRKLVPATGSEVRIDAQGNILVNGKPKVFIGWYGGVPTEDPRRDAVALQDIQTPAVLSGLDPNPVREAFAKGIYSIVSIEPGRMYYTFNWWRDSRIKLHEELKQQDAPSEEFVGYLKQLVNCVKDEPGLVGYYLADEPEINDARSAYLEAMYRLMQELDPYHPVMITNDTLDGIVTHGYRACDIINPDPYSPAWDYVPNFLKRCHEVAGPDKAIMLTLWHSSTQAHFSNPWGTAPAYPYRVMREQYLVGVAQGCRGYTAYTSCFFMPEVVLRYGLPPIWREVRFLEPAMAHPLDKPQVTASAEMSAWAGQANGQLYLIVVNHKPGARPAKISHPALAKVKSLLVVSEGRTVPVAGGALSDQFAEGDVHVYTADPAGAKLPTVAQVEQDLAAQEQATIKPGNLLHVSQGIRARAAEGAYAPWFYQYYYYAMNGITDDLGWHLSHTDKPSWLEITLPQAKSIGRVVVYTPNLKDYDLQFQGPDGAVRVAEIRSNDSDIAEHTFNPPVATLKLRITALAVRDGQGTKGATVREIEAYEQPGSGAATPVKTVSAGGPAISFVAPKSETEGAPVLWREDFSKFETAPKYNWDGKDTKWVLNAEKLSAVPVGGAQAPALQVASIAPEGYAGMTHFFPADPQFRYFQVKISKIEGEGYKWATASCGEGSGKVPCRTGVHTTKSGIYTVDTHYVNEGFANGTLKQAFVSIFAAGSGKNPDGTGKRGPQFTYDWLQLVRRPVDGLIVTMADGSPLPPVLKQGDELLYRVFLEKPALDVSVEALGGASYTPVLINKEPYVQLLRVGAGDGREWAAQVKLGPGTGPFDASKGYPILFRAAIAGGAIPDTSQTVSVKFE
ncbi:hypothetical protein LLH23_08285 [bacterium]|nr:hypothetical protein [bacterium]